MTEKPDNIDEVSNVESDEDVSDTCEDGSNDLTRPSEWKPSDKLRDDKCDSDNVEDSTGHTEDSPDFVDENLLISWETGEDALSGSELEQKRLEAAQYKLEGNALYLEGKTLDAIEKYTAGLRVCPLKFTTDRAVLYANRGQMKRVLGLNDHAVRNCSKAIELNPSYIKALLRRAEIYEETDKLDESLKDYQSVLSIDPKHVEANRAVRSLPAKIEQRNEKLKAEMMDNLKKLGNMVLNPFGLSTNNFKMEQNENGSYNIQFQPNQ